MRARILILLLILFPTGKFVAAQVPTLSAESSISLLTCGPGPEVYTYFGHSALRVTDPALKIDRVYNYGTFDFSVPNFYAQFISGKLNYMLSVVRYKGFVPEYIAENRFIKELKLNLSPATRQELFSLLEINYLPENRHYWYDFFLDNCSTRIRDIVVKANGDSIQWPVEPAEHLTYRQLIMPYISLNHWAKTGILLMLSSGADRKSTQDGYMFLPDHMHRLFSQAKLADGSPLCSPEKIVFLPDYPKPIGTGLLHPYTIFSILLALSWFLVLYKGVPMAVVRSFFSLLLAISGVLGLIFTYMWLFSAHLVCHANLNLAWAFPLHIILSITIWLPKAQRFNKLYSQVMIVITGLFLVTFTFWKQQIPFEAILFCLSLLPGLIRFSGLQAFRNPKAQNQAN